MKKKTAFILVVITLISSCIKVSDSTRKDQQTIPKIIVKEGNKNLLDIPSSFNVSNIDNKLSLKYSSLSDYYLAYEKEAITPISEPISSEKVKGYDDFFIDPKTGKNLAYSNPKIIKEYNTQNGKLIIIKDSLPHQILPNYELPVVVDRIDLLLIQNEKQTDGLNIFYTHEGTYASTSKFFYISADTVYLKTFRIDEERINLINSEQWLIQGNRFKKL